MNIHEKTAILVCDISLPGGVETVSLDLAKSMQTQGRSVIIITCRNVRNASFSDLAVYNIGTSENRCRLNRKDIHKICHILRKKQIQKVIVQLNGPHKICLIADMKLLKAISASAKISLRIHGSPKSYVSRYRLADDPAVLFAWKYLYTVIRYRPYAFWFFRKSQKYVSEYVTLSNGCRRELKKYYGLDSLVIKNPYLFQKDSTDTGSSNIVLWAGRISREKNVQLAVKAWSRVKAKGWQLYIAGSGNQNLIKRQAQALGISSIRILGEKSREDVLRLMETSQILLVTSFHEGFPLVISEAMNRKNAVITTRYDGFSNELIQPGNSIVTRYDSEEIADALNRLISDKKLLKKMQEHAYKTCQAFYTTSDSRNEEKN